MELKHSLILLVDVLLTVLIVPYGIETRYFENFSTAYKVLIVPYGIETLISSKM